MKDKYYIFNIYTSFTDLMKGMPNELCLKLESALQEFGQLYTAVVDIEKAEKTEEFKLEQVNSVNKKREMLGVLDKICRAAEDFKVAPHQLEILKGIKNNLIESIEQSGSKSGEFQREWTDLMLDALNENSNVSQRAWNGLLRDSLNENSGYKSR